MKKRFAVLEVWEALDASKSKEAKRQLLLADDGSSDLVLMNTSSMATPLPDQEQTDDDEYVDPEPEPEYVEPEPEPEPEFDPDSEPEEEDFLSDFLEAADEVSQVRPRPAHSAICRQPHCWLLMPPHPWARTLHAVTAAHDAATPACDANAAAASEAFCNRPCS